MFKMAAEFSILNPQFSICLLTFYSHFRYTPAVPSLHIIFASTSGHTEFVVDTVMAYIKEKRPDIVISSQRAEKTAKEDFIKADMLLLASSTWNTGNVEGQLNPHMYTLLMDIAKDLDLAQKPVAVIGLGDDRYYYTANAAHHLEEFVKTHNGKLIEPILKVINEPYDQLEAIHAWADQLLNNSQFSILNS